MTGNSRRRGACSMLSQGCILQNLDCGSPTGYLIIFEIDNTFKGMVVVVWMCVKKNADLEVPSEIFTDDMIWCLVWRLGWSGRGSGGNQTDLKNLGDRDAFNDHLYICICLRMCFKGGDDVRGRMESGAWMGHFQKGKMSKSELDEGMREDEGHGWVQTLDPPLACGRNVTWQDPCSGEPGPNCRPAPLPCGSWELSPDLLAELSS